MEYLKAHGGEGCGKSGGSAAGVYAPQSLNASAIPVECQECGWDTVAESVEQMCLCLACLVLVALARASCYKILVEVFHKEPSASICWPMWEGPVFLTQFMGMTETLVELTRNECVDVRIVSGILLVAVPGAFIVFATTQISRWNQDGSLAYDAAERVSWESRKDEIAKAKWYRKVTILHEYLNDLRSRGSWGEDNQRERHWMFMVGDFTKTGWLYCVWLLLRKMLVIIVMEHLDGALNASLACSLQVIDTALLLLLLPFNDWQTMGSEGVAALSTYAKKSTLPF